ncbi:hypothetical protein LEP1GSC066_3677 [Leptospira sp. serovar Kenya str. Sh9]|uniref:Uncharacterized protein n=1 Tax=Leptospira borgpetersenii str. Brem 328 TaxID=1049780 RepID=A0ABC9SD19_LEPBO|nr:hypothetical protein LEP1GSC066_3677 [Leptospira sp. serovar Kenya str. Sh9]EMN12840.1 hypothetical protein LEP1GSC055_3420 [Leptospira borgpetersenii str. Brem 307]EMN15581.1 hypothetical protein LEP1GSC056_3657 [Leptospira borgpetersenii str. Brem 328]
MTSFQKETSLKSKTIEGYKVSLRETTVLRHSKILKSIL